ncbi:MAG: hypothetical protein H3C30_17500 [Candidatus Hydrogenedentes bacterium]|nr:hypothetical protein [Candidatus Hydrogenedentota bacterium]
MRTHQEIDERSLVMARAIAARIDNDPRHEGLRVARENCVRWLQRSPSAAVEEWRKILEQDWGTVRTVLLDESEHGRRLRQSSPFCGIISPAERWEIYRRFSEICQKTTCHFDEGPSGPEEASPRNIMTD